MSRYRQADRGSPKPARLRDGTKDARGRLVDMSLPPEERNPKRRKAKVVGGTQPAQLGHGRGSRARKNAQSMARKQPRPRRKGSRS